MGCFGLGLNHLKPTCTFSEGGAGCLQFFKLTQLLVLHWLLWRFLNRKQFTLGGAVLLFWIYTSYTKSGLSFFFFRESQVSLRSSDRKQPQPYISWCSLQ